jgi:Zn-dependent protease
MLTALGGPAASLLLGMACFVAMVVFVAAAGGSEDMGPGATKALRLLKLAVLLNVFGAVLNLLPIPPLDGSSILEFFLPRGLLPAWSVFRSYSWVLFVILMATKVLDRVLEPAMKLTGAMADLGIALGNGISGG